MLLEDPDSTGWLVIHNLVLVELHVDARDVGRVHR